MKNKIKFDLFNFSQKILSSKEFKFYKINKRYMMDFDPSKDYYKILGIDHNATEKQI